jgi:hypothetical protein
MSSLTPESRPVNRGWSTVRPGGARHGLHNQGHHPYHEARSP